MLPSELLVARKYRDTIRPIYAKLTEGNLELAENLIDAFKAFQDRRKKELEASVRMLEKAGPDYRLVRGLAVLLERRCQFQIDAAISPTEARQTLFHAAAREGIPITPQERQRIIEQEAESLKVEAEDLEGSLYADLEEEQVLIKFHPVGHEELLKEYNLGLTQTLLFRSSEMEFTTSRNWQQIFRSIKWLGLIYTIQQREANFWVKLDGPVSLFKLGHRYGTSLAKLLPHIVAAPSWSIQALILRRRGDRQLLKLELDSHRHSKFLNVRDLQPRDVYDSLVEESFANRFKALRTGWKMTREPGPLPVGKHVMIPDFLFEKAGMMVYMEVAGFWTPEYIRHKLDQLRAVEGVDMIVAVDRTHACQQLDRLGRKLNIVYYKGKVPLRPIIDHLRAREEALRSFQSQQLREMELKLEGPIVTLKDLSQRLGVLEEALMENIKQRDTKGYSLMGDTLIQNSTLEKVGRHLEEKIGDGSISLREATELVEDLGVTRPSRVLEHLGYSIEWHGIDPDKAEVKRKE